MWQCSGSAHSCTSWHGHCGWLGPQEAAAYGGSVEIATLALVDRPPLWGTLVSAASYTPGFSVGRYLCGVKG